jgi:outer membrane protein TolC
VLTQPRLGFLDDVIRLKVIAWHVVNDTRTTICAAEMTARLLPLIVLFAGCASTFDADLPSTPATPWNPPASAVPPPLPRTEPPVIEGTLTLARAIDIALANNPNTRVAWLEARQSEALVGSERAAFLPEVDVNASIQKTNDNDVAIGPSIGVSYLLFDFGGRAADVEQARQTLIAAGFTHNQVIQDIVLLTERAYYGVLNARALVDAQNATLKERRASLDSAEARHRAGVATIADVLEARTALSQAQLTYETFEGQLRQQEGLLATTMAIPVTTKLDIGTLPTELPLSEMSQAVDALIAQAATLRPELAASRAIVRRAEARVRSVRSAYLPAVGVTANAGHFFSGGNETPYSIGLALRFPLFTGFRNVFDLRAARLGVDIATEDARGAEQQVALDVWSSYHALSTATQRVRTSRDLLRSAQESVDVALGRYRGGVGTILELLTAQAAVELARAQEVQARADWFVAVAQLAHDTGTLGPRSGQQ